MLFRNLLHKRNTLLLYYNPIVRNINSTFTFTKNYNIKGNKFVQNLRHNEWKYIELHHGFPGMFTSHKYIEHWKNLTLEQNCTFLQTILLRDPLSRFLSNVAFNEVPKEIHLDFVESRQNWLIRYLLFGTCDKFQCGYDKSGNFAMTTDFDETIHLNFLQNYMQNFDVIG